MADYVHLRAHSEYSLVDGILRIKPTIARVAELGMPALALTDLNNMFAAVKFYRAAVNTGIKPILGADVLLLDDQERVSKLALLIMNDFGYSNLVELISRAHTTGQVRGQPYVKRTWLSELNQGLVCLSGAASGDIGRALVNGNTKEAEQLAKAWSQDFEDRFYLEVQRTGRAGDEDQLHGAVELAQKLELPLVATNEVCFLNPSEFEAHEARTCIHQGATLADPRRSRDYSEQQYLRSPEEMAELFADLPEALENTIEIAKRCNFELGLGQYYLPEYPTPEDLSEADYLREVAADGLSKRCDSGHIDTGVADLDAYHKRLKLELDIIIEMGFAGYFLIVMDFIRWAKDNGIPVGPGRGSGAGSLVAYALEITDLDPIAYDLLFERFLNPERVSMPDFDIDFCMENRDRVIAYVAERYGRQAVSQIVTFGTMAAKAVVRDVARVQGKSYGLADRLSKMIPFEVGMTLDKAFEQEEKLREFLDQDEEAQEIWDMALQLEGVSRNCGKHAGGVVIAPTKLTDFAPLYCDEAGENLVTQYDKDDVESVGLVKFDFLGLRTLTIIDWAVKLVNERLEREKKTPLDIQVIPLDDTETFELLKRAETTAVFQLESRGMKDLIKRLGPENFEEIVALVALFRPGPLESGMVNDFIERKHGKQAVAYPHPKYQHEGLKPVLESTYGIILYQEQVMQIAQVIGGYSLGGADLLRRAMGKKKPEEMAKQREIFTQGAADQGIDDDLATNLFDLMEKFAGYGFNKSHSAAYALIAYQTAWLKAHYPAEFMAAVMSSDMQNTDKVVGFIDECNRMGLDITPPDVNAGSYTFTVNRENQIVYGLGAIKGLGEGAIESIIQGRETHRYKDLHDFCARIDLKKVSKRSMEALVRSGALDALVPDYPEKELGWVRALLTAQLPDAIGHAELKIANASAGMTDMFALDPSVPDDEPIEMSWNDNKNAKVESWTTRERLRLEKETLGLYLTGHPIEEFAGELEDLVSSRLADLRPGENKQWLGGLILDKRTVKTKRGDLLGILTLDDRSARVEVTLFSDAYRDAEALLLPDTIVLIEGQVEHDDYSGNLRVRGERVKSLYELRRERIKGLHILSPEKPLDSHTLDVIKDNLKPYCGGKCPVKVEVKYNGYSGEVRLGASWSIEPRDEALQELRQALGPESLRLEY